MKKYKFYNDGYVSIQDLKVGDLIMEDTCPEVYEVKALGAPDGTDLSMYSEDGFHVQVQLVGHFNDKAGYEANELLHFYESAKWSLCLVKVEEVESAT